MSGRAVLVVGGTSGIGLATALRLAADGDSLALVARDAAGLAGAEQECRDAGAQTVLTFAADVRDGDAVGQAVQACVAAFGTLDALIHTATVMAYGRIEDVPSDVFAAVVDVAVQGTLNLAQAVLPVFREQGRGVFVSVNSLLGSVTVPAMGAYATAKWAQRAMLRTLQQEVRDVPGVRVCIVSPGSINTPIYYQAANFLAHEGRPPVPVLQPEHAAEQIVRLLNRPRGNLSVPVGPGNPLIISGFRLAPWLYDRMVGPLFRLAAVTRRQLEPTSGNVLNPRPADERARGRWPAP